MQVKIKKAIKWDTSSGRKKSEFTFGRENKPYEIKLKKDKKIIVQTNENLFLVKAENFPLLPNHQS